MRSICEKPWSARSGALRSWVTEYVKDIGYDEFGQRVALELGNGVETTYTYDEDRRWLEAITTVTSDQKTLQGITYRFDLVGNILGVGNRATAWGKGYTTSSTYAYDDLDQLVEASGTLTKTVSSSCWSTRSKAARSNGSARKPLMRRSRGSMSNRAAATHR